MRNDKTARQQQIANFRKQQDNDWFFGNFDHDEFDRTFEKSFVGTAKTISAIWIVLLLANLAALGLVAWAVIELVQWITSK